MTLSAPIPQFGRPLELYERVRIEEGPTLLVEIRGTALATLLHQAFSNAGHLAVKLGENILYLDISRSVVSITSVEVVLSENSFRGTPFYPRWLPIVTPPPERSIFIAKAVQQPHGDEVVSFGWFQFAHRTNSRELTATKRLPGFEPSSGVASHRNGVVSASYYVS